MKLKGCRRQLCALFWEKDYPQKKQETSWALNFSLKEDKRSVKTLPRKLCPRSTLICLRKTAMQNIMKQDSEISSLTANAILKGFTILQLTILQGS